MLRKFPLGNKNVEKNKFEKRGEKNWNRLDLKVEFEVVIIIAEDEGFKKKFDFEIWSFWPTTQSFYNSACQPMYVTWPISYQ